jgi:hypothetical protein
VVPNHVFAIGDIHGADAAFAAALNAINGLPGLGRRLLVQTGDMIDRGPASVPAVHRLWASGDRFDEVIHLPGNRKALLLVGLRDGNSWLWYLNGGKSVLEEHEVPRGLSQEDRIRRVEEAVDLIPILSLFRS